MGGGANGRFTSSSALAAARNAPGVAQPVVARCASRSRRRQPSTTVSGTSSGSGFSASAASSSGMFMPRVSSWRPALGEAGRWSRVCTRQVVVEAMKPSLASNSPTRCTVAPLGTSNTTFSVEPGAMGTVAARSKWR